MFLKLYFATPWYVESAKRIEIQKNKCFSFVICSGACLLPTLQTARILLHYIISSDSRCVLRKFLSSSFDDKALRLAPTFCYAVFVRSKIFYYIHGRDLINLTNLSKYTHTSQWLNSDLLFDVVSISLEFCFLSLYLTIVLEFLLKNMLTFL